MKIGVFSNNFNIPATTIRYYIDSGILVPNKKNSQYIFTERDIDEMTLILKLKDLSFSTEEIKHFLQVIRVYNENDDCIYDQLCALYKNKRSELERKKLKINQVIYSLGAEIQGIEEKSKSDERYGGIPLNFASYLACPNCSGCFDFSNVKIHENQIHSGILSCKCGYNAVIEDGILLVNSDTDFYQSPAFHVMHYGELPDKDQDFVFFRYMNRIAQQASALNFKAYAWIDSMIQSENPRHKIIFVPDLASHFLYKYIDSPYLKDSLIIVSGFSKKTIASIKSHIDPLAPNMNILYVANTIYEIPIRKKQIDLWIDATSSYNFSFFHKTTLHDCIDPYMSAGAFVVGLTKYVDSNAVSLTRIKELYTNRCPNNSLRTTFEETLKRTTWVKMHEEELGYVTNPGDYYEYMVQDEKHHYLGYCAKKV